MYSFFINFLHLILLHSLILCVRICIYYNISNGNSEKTFIRSFESLLQLLRIVIELYTMHNGKTASYSSIFAFVCLLIFPRWNLYFIYNFYGSSIFMLFASIVTDGGMYWDDAVCRILYFFILLFHFSFSFFSSFFCCIPLLLQVCADWLICNVIIIMEIFSFIYL